MLSLWHDAELSTTKGCPVTLVKTSNRFGDGWDWFERLGIICIHSVMGLQETFIVDPVTLTGNKMH